MAEPIARVHVDNFDPEVYTGDTALLVANKMADVFRADFPGAVVGVSYNPEAAQAAKRLRLEAMGFTEEAPSLDHRPWEKPNGVRLTIKEASTYKYPIDWNPREGCSQNLDDYS